jgi:predicted lipase
MLTCSYFCGNFYRNGAIFVTMYNFGSPRVGNRKFAEVYNVVTIRPFTNFEEAKFFCLN